MCHKNLAVVTGWLYLRVSQDEKMTDLDFVCARLTWLLNKVAILMG